MRQIPSDNWLMSELIFRIKPDYIIEAGTLFGGSALYYAAVLELVNPDGKIIAIDCFPSGEVGHSGGLGEETLCRV